MSNDHPVAPTPPRRVSSGQRATASAAPRPQRIRRVSSGERATEANGGISAIPEPARRLARTTTTTRP